MVLGNINGAGCRPGYRPGWGPGCRPGCSPGCGPGCKPGCRPGKFLVYLPDYYDSILITVKISMSEISKVLLSDKYSSLSNIVVPLTSKPVPSYE